MATSLNNQTVDADCAKRRGSTLAAPSPTVLLYFPHFFFLLLSFRCRCCVVHLEHGRFFFFFTDASGELHRKKKSFTHTSGGFINAVLLRKD